MSERPVLIAECCQNHGGSRDTLARMVDEAAAAGADYVKIQAIRSAELVRRERFEEGVTDPDGTVRAIRRPFEPERERLAGLDLDEDDERWFVEACRRAGVRSMITVFTRHASARYRAMGFDAVKVASYDCPSVPLLRELAADWDTVVVSTGASHDHEIEVAAAVFRPEQLTLLHAVTIYPTALDQLHLARMGWLRTLAPRVGFSDHTPPATTGVRAAELALALGADAIERHFTVLDPSATRDGPVSIDPAQLARLRAFADLSVEERMASIAASWPEWRIGLGEARRELGPTELLNRDYYAGRFAAWVDGRQVMNWEE